MSELTVILTSSRCGTIKPVVDHNIDIWNPKSRFQPSFFRCESSEDERGGGGAGARGGATTKAAAVERVVAAKGQGSEQAIAPGSLFCPRATAAGPKRTLLVRGSPVIARWHNSAGTKDIV